MGILSAEIQSVVDLANANQGADGLMQALLAMLDNAPDGSIISAALMQIEPDSCKSDALRRRASDMLLRAESPELAARWLPQTANVHDSQSNVVSFRGADGVKHVPPGDAITFDDIGGLEAVKDQVRRKIIKPFQSPGLFQAFKRRAGGGVLMYGPPGCGKTMLARALTNECKANFVSVRAADVLDMYHGIAEKRIADLFARARASRPTVLFFDEVEALAQRRQFDAHQKVNTVVSALLSEMDGLSGANDGILFLGATNLPWSLDSAFRRPGRFDRTLFVPPPDRIARLFVLKSLLAKRPVEDRLSLEPIVERTPGYSGADLASLIETATDYAIDDSESADKIVPLSARHFEKALRECRPSTGEWLAQARSYSDYSNQDGLYDDLKEFLAQYAR